MEEALKVKTFLKEICRRLLEYDPDIVEIVQFGSSVYAPEYARDVDILVLTKEVKEYGGYLDVAYVEDSSFDVDVVAVELGRKVGNDFIRGVLGAFKVLYGNGKHLLEYAKALSDPAFEEARSSLRVASSLLKLALETANQLDRDRLFREAFDALFHTTRMASMSYLSTKVSRWGLIRTMLPEPYKSEFKEFINILHIEYFYHGNYPKDIVKEEFDKWHSKVEKFINRLESEVKRKV